MVRRCSDRAGIPRIRPHDLRHSAASFAVSAGANVKAVQKMLGRSSAAMTLEVYADLFDGDLNAVSDALGHAVSLVNMAKMWANQ
ncbi:tyrosine-type recombinase/integrase [Paenarthrobacter sp. AB444]|uniref:tyrosine-type recombinase/integrase n=1 Tax=Paenarthrobacter sp. AB444 TaxID=3025681 RepID=UPI0023670EDF|nr:tyrosine-type recombinase/integrase [Paenarthrobacter sp. AB444]MDD7836004.1 tyrosine-type recombinase/integrase [Paenarthrobacter sp. AB444]